MVRFSNTNVYGFHESMIASGYPMLVDTPLSNQISSLVDYDKDFKRLGKLGRCKIGTGHDSALKGCIVQTDITYPQYFTPQLQRYNWISIISSQSKMHTLVKNKDIKKHCNKYVLPEIVDIINHLIYKYNNTANENKETKYEIFMQIVSNLPMGYELTMRISTNFLQLKTIYLQRKNHRLQEDWGSFIAWSLGLPHFKEIIGVE